MRTESEIIGKGGVMVRVEDQKGEFKIIELKDTLYIPEKSRKLIAYQI